MKQKTKQTKIYVTLQQANAMLPTVEKLLLRLQMMQMQSNGLLKRWLTSGFEQASPRNRSLEDFSEHAYSDLTSLKMLCNAMIDTSKQLEQMGCQIQDLSQGNIAWLALHQDREICYCWQLGEQAITYWNEVGHGFAKRRRLDDFC